MRHAGARRRRPPACVATIHLFISSFFYGVRLAPLCGSLCKNCWPVCGRRFRQGRQPDAAWSRTFSRAHLGGSQAARGRSYCRDERGICNDRGHLGKRAKRMRINVWFRQGGYLFLARHAGDVARLENNMAVQNRCGARHAMLAPEEARGSSPSSSPTASSPPLTTRRTASSSRGRSCGATRTRPRSWRRGSTRDAGDGDRAARWQGAGGFRITTPAWRVHRRTDCRAARRVVARGRAARRRRSERPLRHEIPLVRAAEAVPEADGVGVERPVPAPSRCAARSSAASPFPLARRRLDLFTSVRRWSSRPRWRARWSS